MGESVISGNIVDVITGRIFPGSVLISDDRIASISESATAPDQFILPGFVDAHIHIESSMLVPSEFARVAVIHGTVATVSDPHEIGNVLGIEGVKFMLANARQTPFKFFFGAPSCVPATTFETAGATIDAAQVDQLLALDEIRYLAEMMNFPGVLGRDKQVMAKIASAKKRGKVVDGHAPGLHGDDARRYIEAGISTDHECFTEAEAREKIGYGMKVIIREGSAACNFEALIGLLEEFPEQMMFCSDDKHPDALVIGHINQLVSRAIARGISPMKAMRAATLNPVRHYGLNVGLLQTGDPADLILVQDLKEFNVLETWIGGQVVASRGKTKISSTPVTPVNNFSCSPINAQALAVEAGGDLMRVIQAIDGQLITDELLVKPKVINGNVSGDVDHDILKLVVINRYHPSKPAVAFVKGIGLKRGAIASSVAHDSHNIVAVGVSDECIAAAVNSIIEAKGGVSLVESLAAKVVRLPVAGLMSADDAWQVASAYAELDQLAKELGSTLRAPYMTLSFLALLVIPNLKLSDLGLFDGHQFKFTSLFK